MGDNKVVAATRVGRWWSVAIPGVVPGSMLRLEWDERATLDDEDGAHIEVAGEGMTLIVGFTKREIRRWLTVVVDWPGVEII